MMDCIFCRIARGDQPADIVYEDNEVLAFRDINPIAPNHFLIIPRRHVATANHLEENDAELAGRLMLTARRLASEWGFSEEGYRLTMNCNGDGGQTVYHMHLHLMAGRRFTWPPG